ncbi:DNA-directed RNA polymerase V subunit 5A-like isoform X2 [Phoenix dactylifera]|uniref:DNA-directed RNA polymerase V subunit 5A-like isoform X2 n=1 Tax=Phoenix dactylifera TaxID=42345 RepID=A0A8B9A9N7_PHODC|nr:DNA-directed RNA polymerase V subunit 5A-like isoform X2 [Phoenix dactylifera]
MEIDRPGCMNSFVDQGSVESHRYFLARRTVLEMLRDRGYSVPAEEINLTLDGFRSDYGESPNLKRLSLSYSLPSPPYNKITELLVNITKHVLKPRHDVLTEEEKQKLLKKYNVEDSQLPRMLETDAVARYYGLQKGQVVKVTYDGELTRSHVTYRCIM